MPMAVSTVPNASAIRSFMNLFLTLLSAAVWRENIFSRLLFLGFIYYRGSGGQKIKSSMFAGCIAEFVEYRCRGAKHVLSLSQIDLAEMEEGHSVALLVADLVKEPQSFIKMRFGGVPLFAFKMSTSQTGTSSGDKRHIACTLRQSKRTRVQFNGPLVLSQRRIDCADAVEDQGLAVGLVLTLPDLKGAPIALDGATIIA